MIAALSISCGLALGEEAPKISPGDQQALICLVAGLSQKADVVAQLCQKISDPDLRKQMEAMIPELRQAAERHPLIEKVAAALKPFNGIYVVAPAGPDWLRAAIGVDALKPYERLVQIDIGDRQTPHDKTYHLLEAVNDDWLANLEGLTDLENLNLANTDIKGPGLKHLARLTKIYRLNLTLCPIADEDLKYLAELSAMKTFGLASAGSNGTGFKYLHKMTALESLNFHHTTVNDDGLREICQMTSIERLEIVHCFWTDSGAANLAQLKNLQRLQVGSRKATGASIGFLRSLPKLRELDLHDLENPSLAIENASQIPTLEVLRIYIPIKEADLQHLAHLPKLQELILNGSILTEPAIKSLSEIKSLKKLSLSNGKPKAGIDKLKAALPNVEIVP